MRSVAGLRNFTQDFPAVPFSQSIRAPARIDITGPPEFDRLHCYVEGVIRWFEFFSLFRLW
jgi:hypothetical protein